ncbi:hypothetical protein SETIT_9G294000v2 [Setaria italica]|uniref:Uncharacterized protein n=1 Tax=Setaria italica TaxID=4555 RepID=A0A368SM46_SETIT|nr:hypothetical protein SETIT_9G294000v2 [Setaria italica]
MWHANVAPHGRTYATKPLSFIFFYIRILLLSLWMMSGGPRVRAASAVRPGERRALRPAGRAPGDESGALARRAPHPTRLGIGGGRHGAAARVPPPRPWTGAMRPRPCR